MLPTSNDDSDRLTVVGDTLLGQKHLVAHQLEERVLPGYVGSSQHARQTGDSINLSSSYRPEYVSH